jgi:hypothetical protein
MATMGATENISKYREQLESDIDTELDNRRQANTVS